jgi:hypothetical protein
LKDLLREGEKIEEGSWFHYGRKKDKNACGDWQFLSGSNDSNDGLSGRNDNISHAKARDYSNYSKGNDWSIE